MHKELGISAAGGIGGSTEGLHARRDNEDSTTSAIPDRLWVTLADWERRVITVHPIVPRSISWLEVQITLASRRHSNTLLPFCVREQKHQG